jgi:glutamine synthetase
MTTAKEVMKLIKDNDVKYADFRFTDPRGKWQHVTFDISMIEEDTFAEGQMFDGSSIAGWKAIHESDMNLMPDPASAVIDPFFAETTLSLVCDVLEPTTGEPYNRDPRGIAKKAEGYAKGTGVGDTIYFGPEAEFFIFDDVKYSASSWTRSSFPSTPTPITRAAISAITSASRRAISPFRRRTPSRTCARKCSARWRAWASRWRSITTRWRPPSTSSA